MFFNVSDNLIPYLSHINNIGHKDLINMHAFYQENSLKVILIFMDKNLILLRT